MFLYYLRVAALSILALSPTYSLYSSQRGYEPRSSAKKESTFKKTTPQPPVKYSIYSRKASENPDTLLFVAPDPKTNKPAVFLTANPQGGYWSARPLSEQEKKLESLVEDKVTLVKEQVTQGPLKGTQLYIIRISPQFIEKLTKEETKEIETMWLPLDELSPMAAISRPLRSTGKKSFVDPTLQNLIKAHAATIKAAALSPLSSSKQQPTTQEVRRREPEERGEAWKEWGGGPWESEKWRRFNKDWEQGPWRYPRWRQEHPTWENAPWLNPASEWREQFTEYAQTRPWMKPQWEGWLSYKKYPSLEKMEESQTVEEMEQSVSPVKRPGPWDDPAWQAYNPNWHFGPWFEHGWEQRYPRWTEAPWINPERLQWRKQNPELMPSGKNPAWFDPNWPGWNAYK